MVAGTPAPRCPLCDGPNASNRKTCLPCLDRLQADPDMPLTAEQAEALGDLPAALRELKAEQAPTERPALPPVVELGRATWLFDDRTVAAMLSEASSIADDPGTDEDLRQQAGDIRANLALEAQMRGVEPAALPPSDPTGEALYAALEQARLDLIGLFLADAGRWGFALTWPEAVERYGKPEHIARIDEALRAARPTA